MGTQSTLEIGQVVEVRQRRYLVERFTAPVNPGDSSRVLLSCVDDDAQGQSLEVLWERELDGRVLSAEAWEAIAARGFDPQERFGAYLNTLRWNCVTATDPNLLQSPFRAGIRLDAYQLEPLRKALRLPRVNLFIADDVGLGKTIEAGLIARELLLRKRIREIVVACPPSMLLQWQEELDSRFGLHFEILDKDYLQRIRRERGFGINPWTTHSRFLISHRLLIDANYAGPMAAWLDTFRPGTLLILDEAHHAAPSSGARYAIDSQITRAIRDLAPRFEHRLFLSATPHNGHSNSFSALLEILDPQRFCRGVRASKKMLDDVMVRRLKEDLREIGANFPKRNVVPVVIDGLPADAPELRLFALLDDYRQLREQRLSQESKRTQSASGLLICGLQQRLLSSIEAFSRTLRVHRRTIERQWEKAGASAAQSAKLDLDLLTQTVAADDDRAQLPEEQLAAEEEAAFALASELSAGEVAAGSARQLFERELELVQQMTDLAETSRFLPDARIRALTAWVRENMCPTLGKEGAAWNELRVIVFTEYEDTRRYIEQQLRGLVADSEHGESRIAIFHGPTPADEREKIKIAFNSDPKSNPVRILIATDAAREGLNLQAHCWNLFHFDVPWNPSRMEQRNGRIDRKLQPNPVVNCRYFFYQQRPEDQVIAALVRKTKTIREELGSLSQVIDSRVASLMKEGIRRQKISALTRDIDDAGLEEDKRQDVAEELEATRERQLDLRKQIERLTTLLDNSQKEIAFSVDHFRSAISSSLEMIGAERLQCKETGNGQTQCIFPALDQREGADPSWAETMDSLRTPRDKAQKFWEWRNEAPIRPVIFKDPGVVTEELVQLHLEQRVVQRLLARFSAQGFVYHDLSRACLAQTTDAVPRVLLIGRLSLYGSGAARLHEELIHVTARWVDPMIRKGGLAPYGREAETKTKDLLDSALLEKHTRTIPEAVLRQLQQAAPNDVRELLPHLQSRAVEFAADAEKKLKGRAEAEAKAMREILELQKKHLEAKVAQHQHDQLKLFNDEERRQLDSDRRYWDKRLISIDEEVKTEPDRISRLYDVKARRVEPVGLVYLWPLSR
ncbi:MAG TPA: DISARM system SNF2-like helicase DrmD [Terriglobales bacterium]|nr:DISARM system SNF2-like helicase DrmD [Terriglobales bacterium]